MDNEKRYDMGGHVTFVAGEVGAFVVLMLEKEASSQEADEADGQDGDEDVQAAYENERRVVRVLAKGGPSRVVSTARRPEEADGRRSKCGEYGGVVGRQTSGVANEVCPRGRQSDSMEGPNRVMV